MSSHAALIIPSPSTISFLPASQSRTCLDARDLLATLETIDELRRRDSAVSKDDSRIDYTSVLDVEDKKQRFSEDLVDFDIKSNVQMKKIYRQIQRQVHSDDNTEPAARLAWEKRSENKCILNKDFNHQKYSNQDKLQLKESKFPPRNRSKSVHSNRSQRKTHGDQKKERSQSLKCPTRKALHVDEILEIIEEAGPEGGKLIEFNRSASGNLDHNRESKKYRVKEEKKSRATVFITSGAMTFLVLAATLVTATFLFSPTIEQIFVVTNLNLTEDTHSQSSRVNTSETPSD